VHAEVSAKGAILANIGGFFIPDAKKSRNQSYGFFVPGNLSQISFILNSYVTVLF